MRPIRRQIHHVVDQAVDTAELSDRRLDDPSTFRGAGQVRADGEHAPAERLDRCHRPPRRLSIRPITDGNIGAGSREGQGDHLTDSPGSTRDERLRGPPGS